VKKLITLMATIFLMGLYAEIIPDLEEYNSVERKVIITNIDAYPNIVLLGCIEAKVGNSITYKIEENIPLNVGYRFNDFRLLAINKELLEISGGIEDKVSDINQESTNKILSDKFIALSKSKSSPAMPGSFNVYVEKKYPMKTDDYYYEITETTNNNLTLKLKKRVITFTDDTADKIIEY